MLNKLVVCSIESSPSGFELSEFKTGDNSLEPSGLIELDVSFISSIIFDDDCCNCEASYELDFELFDNVEESMFASFFEFEESNVDEEGSIVAIYNGRTRTRYFQ
jgi:hypothetical protein